MANWQYVFSTDPYQRVKPFVYYHLWDGGSSGRRGALEGVIDGEVDNLHNAIEARNMHRDGGRAPTGGRDLGSSRITHVSD